MPEVEEKTTKEADAPAPAAPLSLPKSYDAVAYIKKNVPRVIPYLTRLPEEERQRRKLRYGLEMKRVFQPFKGFMVTRKIYGAARIVSADIEWTVLEKKGLAVGNFKPGVLEKIAEAAENDRAREEHALKLMAQDKIARKTSFEQQAHALIHAHIIAILKIAGVKKARRHALRKNAALLQRIIKRAGKGCALSQLLAARWKQVAESGLNPAPPKPPPQIENFHAEMTALVAEIGRGISSAVA